MQPQALYIVDYRGRYRYIWAESAAKAREQATDPSLPEPVGAPHQHPMVTGSPHAGSEEHRIVGGFVPKR